MRLLIITQKVDQNDPALGFFHRWLELFASHTEKLSVIALSIGGAAFPKNVSLFALGKGNRVGRLLRFFRTLFSIRKEYDVVFVHMNPVYLALAGWWWRLSGKYAALWYTHKKVDLKLRVAAFFANVVFTAVSESFRLKSRKVVVVGHGIDTEFWKPPHAARTRNDGVHRPAEFIVVGRVTPAKRLDIIIEALGLLKRENFKFHCRFFGVPATAGDEAYFEILKKLSRERGVAGDILFSGAVSATVLRDVYHTADVLVHASETGGLDKVVLEALVSGLPVLVTDELYRTVLPSEYIVKREPIRVAEEIRRILHRAPAGDELRRVVLKDHELSRLIEKIMEYLRTHISK